MIGNKSFLEEEKFVKDFAFSSVCSIKDIEIGEVFCEIIFGKKTRDWENFSKSIL